MAFEPLAPAHAVGLHAAVADPIVERYLSGPDELTLESVQARIDRAVAGPGAQYPGERWWNYALRLRSDGAIIGRIEATTYGAWGEIAYLIGQAWWRQGLASEAVQWLIHHLVEHDIRELWAAVHAENEASKRLLLRCGFTASPPAPDRTMGSFDPGDDAFVWRAD